MYESLIWSPVWIGIWVIIGIIVAVRYRTAGVLLLALVGYLGVQWSMWDYVNVVFWVAWLIGLIGLIGFYATYHPRAIRPATLGSRIALGIVIAMVLVSLLAGLLSVVTGRRELRLPGFGSLNTSIQQQLDSTNAAVKAMKGSLASSDTVQKAVDAQQNARLDALEKAVAELQKHDVQQDKAIAGLKANIKQVQDNVINMTPSPRDLTTAQVAEALSEALAPLGWKPPDVSVGTIDWSKDPIEAGTHAFNHRITTLQELAAFLNGNSPQSQAARTHLKEALPASEWQRALSGEGFVPVQFNKQTCYSGNGYFLNGGFRRDDGKTCRAAGDVWWVYVDSKVHVVWDASVRADCGNGGLTTPPSPVEQVSHQQTPTPTSTTNLPPTRSTSRPPAPHTTHPSTSTTTSCVPLSLPKGYVRVGTCGREKSQTKWCMRNASDPSCPQPGAGVPPQHNPGQPTGRTTGAPATPTSSPSASTAPGGSSGTSTSTPTGTPTCNPEVGCGATHTSPPPTGIS